MRLILIAFVPRSGSTLSFSILEDLLGLEHSEEEIFGYNDLVNKYGIETIHSAFDPSPEFFTNQVKLMNQVKASIQQNDDQVGVIKTNWVDFNRWLFTKPIDWAETVDFIFVDRLNLIRQAYSLLIAQETGVWHLDSKSAEVSQSFRAEVSQKLDFRQMTVAMNEMNFHRHGWERYFSEHSIAPIRLMYEEIASDPIEVMKDVLNRLGISQRAEVFNLALQKTSGETDELITPKFLHLYLKEVLERYIEN